jgi:hypothetical protein
MAKRLLPLLPLLALLPFYGMLLILGAAASWQQKDTRRNGPYRYRDPFLYRRRRFKLHLMPVQNQRRVFRFTEPEIRLLAHLFRLDQVQWCYRNKPSPVTALCVVLARFAYPNRWIMCCGMFGKSQSWLSAVFNDVVHHLVREFGSILEWHPQLNDYGRLRAFGAAIEAAGDGGNGRIWGFIDGTFLGFSVSNDLI